MTGTIRLGIAIAIASTALGCFGPEDRRPGLHLSGEVAAAFPSDWAFTNDHRQIAIEVQTPYLLPHSVTIWCAELDGELYIAARNPETKRWPGWVDRDPNVRLQIGSPVFEVRLASLEEPDRIARVREAYAAKYDPSRRQDGEGPPMRYWRVKPRS